ncbi:MAG TPA: histidinol-phosphate transaminase [Gemmatimonadaceae bacterium]
MPLYNGLSRRGFVGGVAGAVGLLAFKSPADLMADEAVSQARRLRAVRAAEDPYDLLAKLSFNENPYGPYDSVLKAMTGAFKYANRYGYPDGGIADAIAKHHGVKKENVLLSAGSGDILDVMGTAFAADGKTVVGVEPSYGYVYSHVSSVRGDALTIPLTSDYRQDIDALIATTKKHYRSVGFVYLCNPNNPTGRIVTKQEVKQLLDGLPSDVPVLIDEAYWDFVEDPNYATSIPYVLEGRPVVVTRTFSKIAALAGMRLGYAIAQPEYIKKMQPFLSSDAISAVVKWGGVAALADTESQAHVKKVTLELRKSTTSQLQSLGYEVIPSETNFFMVNLKRPVKAVSAEFEKKGVLVGRPFPPMNNYLRVSVGNPTEMNRFIVAFKEIMATPAAATSGG